MYSVQEAPISPQSVNPNLPMICPLRPSGKSTILLVSTDTLIGPAIALGRIKLAKHSRLIYGPSEDGTVHLRSVERLYGLSTACRKVIRFIYGLSEGCTVYLRSVRRLYGSSTAYRKAMRFIYGLLEDCTVYLWPVGRPYGLLYGLSYGL